MIDLAELLTEKRVACVNRATSKKRVLELLSELLAADVPGLAAGEVFTRLCDRERIGGTGLGHGVAIPHGRLAGISRAVCAFLKLRKGVDYDAGDRQPVDLICGLVVPEESTSEHLEILAVLAEMFSDEAFCARMRAAASSEELYQLLISWRPQAFREGRVAGT